jgi:hypothetical protein
MAYGNHNDGHIRRSYMLSLLKSRRALTRILESLSRWTESDVQVARALAERPEALTALHDAIRKAELSVRAQKKRKRKGTPARPYFPDKFPFA